MKKAMKKITKKQAIILSVIGGIVLLLAIAISGIFIWWSQNTKPFDSDCVDCEIHFSIQADEGFRSIADRLERDQIIRSSFAFQIFARLNNSHTDIQSGSYTLAQSFTLEQILAKFTSGDVDTNTFRITFLPGETLVQHKKRFLNLGYTEAEVEAGFNADFSTHPVFVGAPADASLEGYIYGETYEFYVGTGVDTIITRTLDELWRVVQENDLIDKYQARGFTLYQGIILASIVQRESSTPGTIKDMPTVAQVFERRLREGIQLGSDAVVAYRADQLNPNRDKTDLSYLYTMDCPWNSRRCKGLPPTPISSPGVNALKAVGSPSDTTYLYFLTGDDDKMYWAHTEAEHERNKKHCPIRCGIM